MNWLDRRYTKVVKEHDPKLFVQTNPFGTRQVMRESFVSRAYDVDGKCLIAYEPAHHYVMALTEDWTPKTPNVDWGSLPILKRLKDIDLWNKESEVNQLEKEQKKADAARAKDFANQTEAFAYDWHSQFKKTFSDVNTSNMNKIDRKRSKEG